MYKIILLNYRSLPSHGFNGKWHGQYRPRSHATRLIKLDDHINLLYPQSSLYYTSLNQFWTFFYLFLWFFVEVFYNCSFYRHVLCPTALFRLYLPTELFLTIIINQKYISLSWISVLLCIMRISMEKLFWNGKNCKSRSIKLSNLFAFRTNETLEWLNFTQQKSFTPSVVDVVRSTNGHLDKFFGDTGMY